MMLHRGHQSVLSCDVGLVLFGFFCFAFAFAGIRGFVSVLQALPLCGAALTFFAAAKKVSKESGLTPPALDLRLRAPNSSSTSHGVLPFTARCQRLESTPHPLHSPVAQPATANGYGRPGGKLCVGRSASHLCALTTPIVFFSPE
jgi:hypothetical protein